MTTDPGPANAAPDPSMDDILASIRRILDEEGRAKPGGADAAVPPATEDVLELDETMLLPEPDEVSSGPVPTPPPILAEPVTMADPPPPPPALPVPMPMPLPVPMPLPMPAPTAEPGLVAPAAAAAAAMSVGALLRTLASERTAATHRGGPTIEDLVREEIRPLLKEWLDTHLPPMVERLVRAEIERVVSRMT